MFKHRFLKLSGLIDPLLEGVFWLMDRCNLVLDPVFTDFVLPHIWDVHLLVLYMSCLSNFNALVNMLAGIRGKWAYHIYENLWSKSVREILSRVLYLLWILQRKSLAFCNWFFCHLSPCTSVALQSWFCLVIPFFNSVVGSEISWTRGRCCQPLPTLSILNKKQKLKDS